MLHLITGKRDTRRRRWLCCVEERLASRRAVIARSAALLHHGRDRRWQRTVLNNAIALHQATKGATLRGQQRWPAPTPKSHR